MSSICGSDISSLNEPPQYFRPFTRESLRIIWNRMEEEAIMKEHEQRAKAEEELQLGKLGKGKKHKKEHHDDDEENGGPKPDPKLEQGVSLPIRLSYFFEQDWANIPLEDVDPFYANIPTFVLITKKKDIFRFSATDAMYCLSPFNPVRRVAIAILTHGVFSLIIITTILLNCYVMIMPASPVTESTEVVFTAIYTFESAVKVIARGFILEKFTYLRDAWNWLDFVVISLAYITMGINLGNLAALRTCRVFRALKTVAIVPGLKTIVGAVIESVKNLRDVIILTVFALSVFGLVGLQIYMGVLTQKCIADFPEDFSEGEERDINWHVWNLNYTNWYPYPPPDGYGEADYPLCGNSSGAGRCPENFTCLQGYGMNPNYGYTSFDSFGWAFLSAFRLMTQDFWESLYQQILRSAGPWHMLFFIVIIFLGSYYLVNLILAIVAMSYDELQKKAEEEEIADAAELEAIQEEEAAREAKLEAHAAKEAAAAAVAAFSEGRGGGGGNNGLGGAGTGGSTQHLLSSPRLFIKRSDGALPDQQMKDELCTESTLKMVTATKMTRRKISVTLSLPGSPSNDIRRGSHPTNALGSNSISNHSSYHSHASRHTYNSHDLLVGGISVVGGGLLGQSLTKESQLIQRARNLYGGAADDSSDKPNSFNFAGAQVHPENVDGARQANRQRQGDGDGTFGNHQIHPETGIELRDVLVLHDIIDQAAASARRSRRRSPAGIGSRNNEEDGGPRNIKEIIKAKFFEWCFKFIDVFCQWDCGFPWNFFKRIIAFVVFDAFTELFITLAIVVNTVFMALDHYGLEEKYTMSLTLLVGNKVFTTIFGLECAMKVIAMSPKYYFQVGWNVFDFIIVVCSLVEVVFEDADLPGLSSLRSFRLLRVFKLAKSWPTLNMLLTIMGQTVGALSNLVFVLVIIIFIFAVMGMQLFAQNYFDKTHLFPGGELPRWNFTDFGHSFLIVFRVLCGEWIESMWDCMLVTGGACVPFFLATVVIGNLVVLNLFLALLLSSFGASSLSPSTDNEPNKLAEAFDRFARFFRWIKNGIIKFLRCVVRLLARAKTRIVPGALAAQEAALAEAALEKERRRRRKLRDTARFVIHSRWMLNNMAPGKEDEATGKDNETVSMNSYGSHYRKKKVSEEVEVKEEEEEQDESGSEESDDSDDESYTTDSEWTEDDEEDEPGEGGETVQAPPGEELEYPTDCMPSNFYEKFPIFDVDDTPFGAHWASLRLRTFRLIENKYFETVVIIMILLSSLALALEDVNLPDNPVLVDTLFYMDRIFTIIFFFEMLMKWLALGFSAYFTNSWCWLDFVIVMVSIINFVAALAGAGSVQAFKTMRTLRALRPLRAMARMQGMRIVVNALVGAIPSIVNVLLVCLIFWLLFAIMGVQLFSGKFHKCLDPEDGTRPDYRIIRNKMECLANNFTWENSVMNFDHVGKAYLSLFQVATFKGWIGIMNDAIDSREIDEQPHREVSFVMYIYFVIFIIFGSFFTLNLFIGVIIDNFNEQKKKSGGSMEMFMTEDQKKYYAAMQKMGNKKPIKAIPKPRWKPQAKVFELVTNKKFDMIIMLFIGLNMMLMTLDHYQMTREWDETLASINSIFVAIFTCECILKVFALRHHYFTEPWNLFDLVVVFLSVAGMVLSDLIEKYFVSPTLLRVVRVAKVGRVLRLVKGAKGIRTLLFALATSLPALFNICLLLFLVMFIFSIFGMSFFMNVKLRGALDDVYNFQTFGQSIILLFQMSTSAGWDGVLDGIMNEDDCDDPDPEEGKSGDCGNTTVGIAFLLSYLVMSFLIIINMYIAVILENYSQATEDVQEGLTDDDYDMYYEMWAQFDPDGSQYVKYNQLGDLLDVLEPPLQICKPNKFKIITMDIPICKDDMMYCVDILDALTKDFFARKGSDEDEEGDINDVNVTIPADRPDYEPVTSTLWRQREEYCVKLIQSVWRKRRDQRLAGNLGGGGGGADPDANSEVNSEVSEHQQDSAHSKTSSIGSHVITDF